MGSRRILTLSLTRSNRTLQRLGGIFSRSRTSTGASNSNDTGDGGQIPVHGSTTNTSATATSSATTNTALPLTPQPTTMSTTTTTATANTSTVVGGRLNILVMYFMRIILVFFFVWLPGMIMYYKAYDGSLVPRMMDETECDIEARLPLQPQTSSSSQ